MNCIVRKLLLFIVLNNIISGIQTQSNCTYGTVFYNGRCEECGISVFKPNARIVGGVEAVAHSWPSQVFILQRIEGLYKIPANRPNANYYKISQTSVCAGTLINLQQVLTAAHCILTDFIHVVNGVEYRIQINNPFDVTLYSLYVGAHDLTFLKNANKPAYPTVKMDVQKIIRHPSYDSSNYLNDIALFILSKPVELNQYVRPACLPNPLYATISYPANNLTIFASGWGTLSEGGMMATRLQNVRLMTYDPRYCSNVERSYAKDWNSQVCAGVFAGGRDTCQGDSGSGLLVYDTSLNKYILAAITSYGDGCGQLGKLGIYTRVIYYHDWIMKNWYTNTSNITKWSPIILFILKTLQNITL